MSNPVISNSKVNVKKTMQPSIIIHAFDDEVWRVNPLVMEKCYKLINALKNFVKIDGGHFSLLYPRSECFNKVLDENKKFSKKI